MKKEVTDWRVGRFVALNNGLEVKITSWFELNKTFGGVINKSNGSIAYPVGLECDDWSKGDITGWIHYDYAIKTVSIGKALQEGEGQS